jgi:hypothetical protein
LGTGAGAAGVAENAGEAKAVAPRRAEFLRNWRREFIFGEGVSKE